MEPQYGLGNFPNTRMRRLRRTQWLRDTVAETWLSPAHLIWPVFVIDGVDQRQTISAMPGVERLSIDLAVEAAERACGQGISSIAIFPVTPPALKSADGRHALDADNLICRATRAIRERLGDKIGIVCDVALDPYTTHGHDGLLVDGKIVNDETISILTEQAVNQAQAGATVIAPSDMMDGRIGAIRNALDGNGFQDTVIMSYAAKYASAFYGPFRDAVGSAQSLAGGDKKTYQMNPANCDEALHEVAMDIREGADIVMVKPGLPYLDIVHRIKQAFKIPVAAYQVSGEYAMLKFASQGQAILERACVLESMLAFRRAGASAILTYYALEIAQWLNE